MYKGISVLNAKATFSEMLRRVSEGQRYTIFVEDEPVADLIPSQATLPTNAKLAMKVLQKLPKIKGVGDDEVTAMIRQGRQ